MMKIDFSKDRFGEVVRFVINGGISFLVDYGLLYFLTEAFRLHYLLSSIISFSASVIVNYLICKYWVFSNSTGNSLKAKIIFIGSSLVGLVLNQMLMWLLVAKIGFYYMIAKIFSTVVVMFWNYIMKRRALI